MLNFPRKILPALLTVLTDVTLTVVEGISPEPQAPVSGRPEDGKQLHFSVDADGDLLPESDSVPAKPPSRLMRAESGLAGNTVRSSSPAGVPRSSSVPPPAGASSAIETSSGGSAAKDSIKLQRTCVCNNGVAYMGEGSNFCTMYPHEDHNKTNCETCNSGFELSPFSQSLAPDSPNESQTRYLCKPQKGLTSCHCADGTCSTGTGGCISCNAGFDLVGNVGSAGRHCVERSCSCANGTPKSSGNCAKDGATDCSACDTSYELEAYSDEDGNKHSCK